MPAPRIPDRWTDADAAGLDEPGLLLYRSNLLGADLRVTNFGGGNTSVKVAATDPLTRETVRVLWVKGSGGDLGSMKRDGFATLHLDRLEALKGIYRGPDHEDEMVAMLPHCTFDLNPRAASIDTPLHAFVPATHVDHMHPDAVIAIAASERSETLTRACFGDEIGWLPWRRPGFELGLQLGRMAAENPDMVGVVLGKHGLFTWAETARDCYATTLRIINRAQDWLDAETRGPVFGGWRVPAAADADRRTAALRLLPRLRGRVSGAAHMVGHVTDAPEVLEFVGSADLEPLAALGTSCPDHFLRTKIRPLVVPADADDATLDALVAGYRADYAAYYDRCRRPDSPALRDPNPVVHLVPGVGMISFAKDKATARIASEFYVNAINVMRGASGVDRYTGLPEQEAFDIEYWLLEEAKLQRMPKPRALAGRIAFVTGGAGGIGQATARRLLSEGACVMLADIDAAAVETAARDLSAAFGPDMVRGVAMDVTDEAAVDRAMEATILAFGGLDILVSNAGIASASPFEDTTVADWDRNMDILGKGYFLAARAGYRLMLTQGMGGAIAFVASKNGLAASAGASAYCAAKAAELHLARCLALEGAPHGIRVNAVNPDAVLRGSRIWQGDWRASRAVSNKVDPDALEEVYRQRSLLKRSVFPEDVAEAIHFLVSDAASKSTGNILNVDAGNAYSFTR